MSEEPGYAAEREDSWARRLWDLDDPGLVGRVSWSYLRDTRVGDRYRKLARAALKLHLECCEHRCERCNDRTIHRCLRCERA